VLSTAGDQVPEMLLVLVVGKLNAAPLQMLAMGEKLGTVLGGLMVIFISSSFVNAHIGLVTTAVTVAFPVVMFGK
jgi:hypothetical protein